MSARGFGSVFMVGGIAAAALGCSLVSLRVASERAALERVETEIVLAQRDIRSLSTEIGTRGRLAQLERWNVKVIRLSAPTADQFVESSFQLATLVRPDAKSAIEAPIVLAAAPAPSRDGPVVTSDSAIADPAPRGARLAGDMMHVASYSKPEPKLSRLAAKPDAARTISAAMKTAPSKPAASKGATTKSAATKVASASKFATSATADPLGPVAAVKKLAPKPPGKTKAANGAATGQSAKEFGSRQ